MPELPEVEIVRQSLDKKIRGQIIKKVIVKNRNLRFKVPRNFERNFKNQKIVTPHPRMHLRNFVIFPLYELNKTWIHPKTKEKINIIISHFNNKDFSDIRIV
mgnify:CR=1 FL=1